MRCQACGAMNPDWSNGQADAVRFCIQCGAELQKGAPEAPPTPPTGEYPYHGGGMYSPTDLGGTAPTGVPRPGGAYPPPPRSSEPIYEPKPMPKKKRSRALGWIIGLLVTAGLLTAGYFFVHIWERATCEHPETCKICGKERGDVEEHDWEYKDGERVYSMCGETVCEIEGHEWQDATCEEPKTCLVCGETEGEALGHDWMDATYDKPKTCSRCGMTQGEVAGWVGRVSGDYTDDEITIGTAWTHPFMFADGVKNWRQMTVYIKISDVTGSAYGTHAIYAHSPSRGWYQVRTFQFTTADVGQMLEFKLEFPSGAEIDGIAEIVQTNGECSFSYSLSVGEAQTM